MYTPEGVVDTGRMPTDALLDRFLTGLTPLDPVAVWAHGSLGAGDYQEGRSDLDLIAVLPRPATARTAWRLGLLHARLRAEPLAGLLHCTYLSPDTVADPDQRHLTWAHQQLFKRTVTPVTRRELHSFGRVLHGESPEQLLPRCRTGNCTPSSSATSGNSGVRTCTGRSCGRRTSGSTWG